MDLDGLVGLDDLDKLASKTFDKRLHNKLERSTILNGKTHVISMAMALMAILT